MKPLVIASNMYNERPQLEEWWEFVKEIADGGVLIVDTGSTDGTTEFFEERNAVVIHDDIIRREGYGPARNHLREMSRQHFPEAHWLAYFDGDERIDPEDFHQLRFLKDYLVEEYDVIAFPRIDWMDKGRSAMAKDWHSIPDWQGRMTRLHSPLRYIRRCHEQIQGARGIYNVLTNPKIHHFHRSTSKEKRDMVGKLCAVLHERDEWGSSYPKHHKEEAFLKRAKEEGID